MGSLKKSHKERKRSKKDRRSRSRSSSSSQSDSEIYERRRKRPQRDQQEDHGEKREKGHSEEDERSRHSELSKHRDDKSNNSEKRRESSRPERERRRSATPKFREPTPPDDKEKLSMSIEETNKLRAKLGLKPLQVEDDGKKGTDENNEIFIRTENISDKKEAEAFREKVRSLREKQKVKEKYGKVRTLAESDEDDDAGKWIDKSRQLQQHKAEAAAREKLLMEMENELGVDDLVKKELSLKKEYTAKDLKGIEIVHKQDRIKEGDTVVLTLKDHGVLDETEDVLENVNLVDDEKAEKNVINKKLGPDTYNPYDDAEVDEFGIVHKKTVLSKYDEEIEGSKKESFKIGATKELRRQNELEEIRNKLQKQKQTLVLPEPSVARDYLTSEEIAAFKKPKKKIRRIRKREILKADDLVALGDETSKVDHGSRNRRTMKEDEEEHLVGPDTDLSHIKLEDDFPEQRYNSRLRKVKNIVKEEVSVQKLAAQIASMKEEAEREGMEEDELKSVPFAPSMTMNSTAEFCRTLGTTSTYVSKELKEEKHNRDFVDEMDIDQESEMPMDQDEEAQKNTWSEVDPLVQQKHEKHRSNEVTAPVHLEAFPILEEEPSVAQGVAGALKLALKKGYIDDESKNNPAAVKKLQDLQAKNYQIEEKYYDEEGRGRRGGGGNHYHGPVSDFRDKSNYKPDVKLDYIDDSGRLLNQKEAFRYLSHKFHGKGSGKNKIDKRQKKIEQLNKLEQMSSSDTPLNTLKLLQEKQRQLQTPYIMLSGGAANTLSGPSGLSKK